MATLHIPIAIARAPPTPIAMLKKPRATTRPITPINATLQSPTDIAPASATTTIAMLKKPRATPRPMKTPPNATLQNPTAPAKAHITPSAMLKKPSATLIPTNPAAMLKHPHPATLRTKAKLKHPNPASPAIDQMKKPDPPSKDMLQHRQ